LVWDTPFFVQRRRHFFDTKVVGRDKLITDGSVLIASNHESFLDPPLVGIAYNDSVYYLARKTLFRGVTKWLYSRWNAIPIDQDAPDMSSLKKIIKILKSGEQVVVFPEGSRTLDGELQRGEAGVGLNRGQKPSDHPAGSDFWGF
jgi:1-acyl-sn-glycerol-3-phosphate acyltransferase